MRIPSLLTFNRPVKGYSLDFEFKSRNPILLMFCNTF